MFAISFVLLLLMAEVGPLSSAVAQVVSEDPAFQVNAYTTRDYAEPDVTADADGNFIVTWSSFSRFGDGTDDAIWARRYDRAGAPIGIQFQVNTYTTNGDQYLPVIAGGGGGSFVIAWASRGSAGSDTDGASIQARRYDGAGMPLGDQFQVNTYATDAQRDPAVAMDAAGGFIVVWERGKEDRSDGDIVAQRYSAAGAPLGSEFLVGTYTTGSQSEPSVAAESGGGYVVVWSSGKIDGDSLAVAGRRYDGNGNARADQFLVNSYTTSFQTSPVVAADPNGGFVVAWESAALADGYGGYSDIRGRRFKADGTPNGGDVPLVDGDFESIPPRMAVDPDGGFLVVWQARPARGGPYARGQRFARDATPVGEQLEFVSDPDRYAERTTVAGNGSRFFVTWSEFPGDGSTASVVLGQTLIDACQARNMACPPPTGCRLPGTCDPASGRCVYPVIPDGTPCEDGDICTSGETCFGSGECGGGVPITCMPQDACHEAGTCDRATGCSNPAKPDGTPCDDGQFCNGAELCQRGTCSAATAPCAATACDESGDRCAATVACGNALVEQAEGCDDANVTSGDGCSSTCAVETGWSCSGTPSICRRECSAAICDDGDPCTIDRCAETTCVNDHITGFDGVICEVAELARAPLCDDALPAAYQQQIAEKVGKAESWLRGAATGTKPKKVGGLLARTDGILRGIERKAAKLNRRGKLSDDCKDAIARLVGERRQLLAGIST